MERLPPEIMNTELLEKLSLKDIYHLSQVSQAMSNAVADKLQDAYEKKIINKINEFSKLLETANLSIYEFLQLSMNHDFMNGESAIKKRMNNTLKIYKEQIEMYKDVYVNGDKDDQLYQNIDDDLIDHASYEDLVDYVKVLEDYLDYLDENLKDDNRN